MWPASAASAAPSSSAARPCGRPSRDKADTDVASQHSVSLTSVIWRHASHLEPRVLLELCPPCEQPCVWACRCSPLHAPRAFEVSGRRGAGVVAGRPAWLPGTRRGLRQRGWLSATLRREAPPGSVGGRGKLGPRSATLTRSRESRSCEYTSRGAASHGPSRPNPCPPHALTAGEHQSCYMCRSSMQGRQSWARKLTGLGESIRRRARVGRSLS